MFMQESLLDLFLSIAMAGAASKPVAGLAHLTMELIIIIAAVSGQIRLNYLSFVASVF